MCIHKKRLVKFLGYVIIIIVILVVNYKKKIEKEIKCLPCQQSKKTFR